MSTLNRKVDRFRVMLGLQEYYFPMIEDIFDFYGLPVELEIYGRNRIGPESQCSKQGGGHRAVAVHVQHRQDVRTDDQFSCG